jgi:hypothetical protein
MSFTKHDAGKLRFDLVDPYFLEGLADVLTRGAAKYSPDNWKNCPEPFQRYYAALQRHLTAYAKGERFDPETGLSHLYHAACCLMFLAYFERDRAETPQPVQQELPLPVAYGDKCLPGAHTHSWNVPLTFEAQLGDDATRRK